MNDVKKDILTIPNLLTFLRILLIPVYAVLYMKAVAMRDYLISAAVLAVSALTDMADGIIARKCKMRSRLGIMLDPFADKLTQGVIMLCLTLRHREILPLLIFFVIKEGFMFVMGCRLLKQKKMLDGALLTGKICTTVLFVGMIALVIFPDLPPVGTTVIVSVCAVFMAVSLISYVFCFFRSTTHIRDIENV
ncbi:MAG: CDP-alcohol phosphatidyltransferase family protein [Clostridia bacterium]|nr:CDP-alcohol phosphatidyltransferase family protein [Clostridia bacterium]